MILGYPNYNFTAILDKDALDALVILQQHFNDKNLFIAAIDKALMVLNEQEEDFEGCTIAIRDLLSLRKELIRLCEATDEPAGIIDFADYNDNNQKEKGGDA